MSTPDKSDTDHLDNALELDGPALESWLADLERDEPHMAKRIRAALAMRETPEFEAFLAGPSVLERSPKLIGSLLGRADGNTDPESRSGLIPGRWVGPYELERLLGAGGMAEVWLAKRADGAFEREVALKLPMVSRLRRDLEERFSRERDILAKLEHPNIARLYDGGVDAEGLPYLAMEYVPGQSLISWCDGHKLGISERLRLFLHVLEALQYAHEKLVIHRDIKPSNILVSESGQVRLLDFGVAKLLDDGAGERQLTSVYGRALTADYASPELLKGDSVDARSDIYSLGVVLHELLSGGRPYQLKGGASLGTLERAIETGRLQKPSTQLTDDAGAGRGTTREKLAQELRGDLDVITLKALASEPSQRYESAAAMADDIQRYLQHRPIQARPASMSYRLKKFAQRNRSMIGASVPAAALLLALGAYELEHHLATRTPSPQSIAVLPLRNESGDAAQRYFSDGISEDLITALAQFPTLKVIGRSSAFKFRDSKEDSRSIGASLGVALLLEGSVRMSGDMIRVRAELIDTSDGSMKWSQQYDRPYKDLFALQDEITRAVTRSIKLKLLPGEHAAEQSDRPPSGNLEAYNALLEGRFHAFRRTEFDLRRSIEFYTQAIELDPRYALAWSWLSAAWASLGEQFLDGERAREEAYSKAREAADRALALAPELAAAHVARGRLLQVPDFDWRGAAAEYRRALALAPNDGDVKFVLGIELAAFGDVERAIELTRQSLATDPLKDHSYSWLANYLSGLHRLDEAERAIRKAIELQPAAAAYHQRLAIIEIQRGHAQAALAAAQGEPPGVWQEIALALAQQIGGDRGAADAALATLIEKEGVNSAYQIAEVYALRNDANKTFEWLDRAWSNRDGGIPELLFDPFILRYKDDPRFAAFCRKVGLPVPGETTGLDAAQWHHTDLVWSNNRIEADQAAAR
jgi:serine/threonine protein kinase/Tfp pilus assembly protein PilF